MHMVARNGDHLLIPFQCELCHYPNLKGTNPTGFKNDRIMLRAMRRENLHIFWFREPRMVSSTWRDSFKLAGLGMRVCLSNIWPVMGLFLLEDSLGIGLAVAMLIRSLEKGKYQSNLQFDTVRKMRPIFSNTWHASKLTLTTSVIDNDTRKRMWIVVLHTHCSLKDLLLGCTRGWGEVHQDKVVTSKALHKLVEGLDEDYLEGKMYERRKR